ncbi:hypothetical protein TNCV_1753491 [Trichonephila clavipes]|nr:hypothetical protein TNCV_1753491 [Trichonephila clavipes]
MESSPFLTTSCKTIPPENHLHLLFCKTNRYSLSIPLNEDGHQCASHVPSLFQRRSVSLIKTGLSLYHHFLLRRPSPFSRGGGFLTDNCDCVLSSCPGVK